MNMCACRCFFCVQDFWSVEVPLVHLVNMLPPLKPRAYSIASAHDLHPGTLDLCVAVVEYKTQRKRDKLVRWGRGGWASDGTPCN